MITFRKHDRHGKRSERIIIRVSTAEKKRIQLLANMFSDGNVSKLIMAWVDRHRSFVK